MGSNPERKTTHELALDRLSPPAEENNVTDLVAVSTPDGVMGMIQSAINSNAPIEHYERLYALHKEMCDRQARIDFNTAMVAFQTEMPPVPKTGENKSIRVSGTSEFQRFARLEEDILPIVSPALLKHGFSATWDTKVLDDILHVTCFLEHIAGHQRKASFAAPVDKRENKLTSPMQKYGAVGTYCRRLSLIQVTGLRVGDKDNDAAPGEKITESQAADLRSSLEENKLDEAKFLKYMKAESLEDIPLTDLGKALTALEKKRQSQ